MSEVIYRKTYVILLSLAYAFSAAALAVDLHQLYWSAAVMLLALLASLVPIFYANVSQTSGMWTLFSEFSNQTLRFSMRLFILYLMPLFLFLLLLLSFHLILTLIIMYTLLLLCMAAGFAFSVDCLLCRTMACVMLIAAAGFSSDGFTAIAMSFMALTCLLSGVTLFLLTKFYINHDRKRTVTIIKLSLLNNWRVYIWALMISLPLSNILVILAPSKMFASPAKRNLLEHNVIPDLFDSQLLNALVYAGVSILLGYGAYWVFTKYLKSKMKTKLAALTSDYIIDIGDLGDLDKNCETREWTGARKEIINAYLKARSFLEKKGVKLRASMTPAEISANIDARFKSLGMELKGLTRLFHQARYSKTEPGERDAALSKDIVKQLERKLEDH